MKKKEKDTIKQVLVAPVPCSFPTRQSEQRNAQIAWKCFRRSIRQGPQIEKGWSAASVTQARLAQKLDCKQAMLSQWEKGRTTFGNDKMAIVLRIIDEWKQIVDPSRWVGPSHYLDEHGQEVVIDPRNELPREIPRYILCSKCDEATPGPANFCRNCGANLREASR